MACASLHHLVGFWRPAKTTATIAFALDRARRQRDAIAQRSHQGILLIGPLDTAGPLELPLTVRIHMHLASDHGLELGVSNATLPYQPQTHEFPWARWQDTTNSGRTWRIGTFFRRQYSPSQPLALPKDVRH